MPFDITIVAIVFALILLIVFFSAIVLYLLFRIKETFRKETRRGATIVKIVFLIGTLFLAGGIFYFLANSMTNIETPNPTATPEPSPTPFATPTATTIQPTPTNTVNPSPTLSPFPTSTPTPTITPTASHSPTPSPDSIELSLSVGYPSTVNFDTQITMSITIINPTELTAHDAIIQTNSVFQSFSVLSSTYPVVGNVINIGNITPGTTTITLELLSPEKPTEVNDTITLVYQEMADSVTSQITIRVRGN